jgi:hypothetical protein
MISREEHLKQVNRFHDILEKVDKGIEEQTKIGETDFNLLRQYFELTSKVWPLVDDCVEQIKDRLDEFEEISNRLKLDIKL